jgi:hypothetical protein
MANHLSFRPEGGGVDEVAAFHCYYLAGTDVG